MLPVLLSIGPVEFRTLNLFLVFAFFGAAFLFWRKGREEHYDEMQIFDSFLLSSFIGLISSRIAFILLHFSQFGFDIFKWLNIFSQSGFNVFVGILCAGLYLNRFARKHKWDIYEIVDFWVTAISFGLAMVWLGMFFDGTSFGFATRLPWGITFPGVFERHHPVQLYFSLFFFLLFYYLSWAEYRYRTFNWYRAGKNSAQTGYLSSIFIGLIGLFSFLMTFVRPAQFIVFGVVIDTLVYLSLFFLGFGLLIHRSGRSLIPTQKRTAPF